MRLRGTAFSDACRMIGRHPSSAAVASFGESGPQKAVALPMPAALHPAWPLHTRENARPLASRHYSRFLASVCESDAAASGSACTEPAVAMSAVAAATTSAATSAATTAATRAATSAAPCGGSCATATASAITVAFTTTPASCTATVPCNMPLPVACSSVRSPARASAAAHSNSAATHTLSPSPSSHWLSSPFPTPLSRVQSQHTVEHCLRGSEGTCKNLRPAVTLPRGYGLPSLLRSPHRSTLMHSWKASESTSKMFCPAVAVRRGHCLSSQLHTSQCSMQSREASEGSCVILRPAVHFQRGFCQGDVDLEREEFECVREREELECVREREEVECVVIGAGVVGLAVARELSLAGREVVVVEAAPGIGMGVSSRSSEVIHAGLYYAPGSLKARLCVEGRKLLYSFCREMGVPHQQTGKLVVATSKDQLGALSRLHVQ